MNSNNNCSNSDYNSNLFYKIFHNKILRNKIYEYVHILNIISFSRDRISCQQLKNNELGEIPFSMYYTKLSIHCTNEDELFDLLDTIELPNSLEKVTFSFNNIRSDIEIIINHDKYNKPISNNNNNNNKPTTGTITTTTSGAISSKSNINMNNINNNINNISSNNNNSNNNNNKLKVLPNFINILNFQITNLINLPTTNILKEIESRIAPESAKFDPVLNNKLSITVIPFTLRIVSLKLGPWFNDQIRFGWIPINQRVEKIIVSNDFNNKIQIGGLPDSFHLKEIHFGDRFNQDLDTGILPSTLESISFGQLFNKPLKKDGILPKSITSIKFAKNSYFNGDFSFKNLKELKTIEFGYSCTQKLSESSLPSESLTKLIVYNPKQIKNFKSSWFKNMQVLKVKKLDYNRYDGDIIFSDTKDDKDIKTIKSIPNSVRKFRLEGNITFDQDVVSKVTQLSVFPTRYSKDLGFKFSKNNTSITHLKLYLIGSPISDQLSGAVNVESLEIYGKFNHRLENTTYSNTLKSLKIKSNFNQIIRLGHDTSIQTLELGSYYQQPLLPNELPSTLTYLKIDSYPYQHNINKNLLPQTLKALVINLQNQSQLESLPDKLESLDISFQNPKTDFNTLQLPSSITLLSIHHNLPIPLSSKWIPNQIQALIIKNGYFNYEDQLPLSLNSIYIPYLYNIPDSILNDKYIFKYIKIIINNPSQLFNNLFKFNLNII